MYNDLVTLQSHQHLQLSLYVILIGAWWYLIVVLIYISIMTDDEHLFMCLWRESHSVMSLWPHGLYSPWNSPGQNTRVGSHSLLKEIFPMQGSNPGLPYCRQIPYQLSHQQSPRIPKWVVYPLSSLSSQSRNQTEVSCIAGGFFTSWTSRRALSCA